MVKILHNVKIKILYSFYTEVCFAQAWILMILCILIIWFSIDFYPHAFFKKASGILQSLLSVRPSRYLLLNHWTKSNQIWCVSCSHEWGVQRHIFLTRPLGPWGGGWAKGQISFNIIKFQLLSQFQRFLNQYFVCLLTDERYKTYQTGFSFGRLGQAPGVGLRGGGYRGGLGSNFFSLQNSTRFGV